MVPSSLLILMCAEFLTTSAFTGELYGVPFPFEYPIAQHRRVDSAEGREEQTSSRVTNERSIPVRSPEQRIQGRVESREADKSHARNGNLTYITGSSIVRTLLPTVGKRIGGESQGFVFPGLSSRSGKDYVPEIPKECEQMGLCEHVPNYPYDHVNDLLAKTNNTRYFNIDAINPSISARGGAEEVLCKSSERILYPQAAKTIDGDWAFVLNTRDSKDKIQGFRVEVCSNVNQPCNPIAYVQEGYRLLCGQKVTLRSMWSLDKTGHMVMYTVPTPSCCTCEIKSK